MKTIKLTYPHTFKKGQLPPTVGAIGFFDGIHKGHQKVIQTAVEEAKANNMQSAVMTFHPHPSAVLKRGVQHVQYITPLKEKQTILNELNIDLLYVIEFNEELSLLSPQAFIDHFIIDLHIKHLVAGFDYTFGHKGKGNMKNITHYARDEFTTQMIDKVQSDEQKISSTRIRTLLNKGEVLKINHLIGRTLSLDGVVIQGNQQGRTIGYPTANLQIDAATLLPKIGVYAVKVIHKGTKYQGMANLGIKPTFESEQMYPTIEVHIFDFDRDIYGHTLRIKWEKYIRKEKKFSSIEALKKQLSKDEEMIRSFFNSN